MNSQIDQFIEFVRDQYKTTDFIPLHVPRFQGNEKKYVLETIDSTFFSSFGEFFDRFEEMMVTISQTQRAVAVVNGTAACK